MSEGAALVNIGELTKPATVLIEKISDAIGGVFEPWQIRRIAEAEAEAEKIKAIKQLEITELQHRALQRFLAEEAQKQRNIEAITGKALSQIEDSAQPQNMEIDWITNFFDKGRLISDEDMQNLWSEVLAGEANSPGKFAKRTVNYLSSLDKYDAILFRSLCSFGWSFENVIPLIYDPQDEIYNQHNINFNSLRHLDDIGLITFNFIGAYQQIGLPQKGRVSYYEQVFEVEFPKEAGNVLDVGKVLLTKVGEELEPICGTEPIPGFEEYIVQRWANKFKLVVSSPNE